MNEALDDVGDTESRPEHEIDCRSLRRLRSGKSRRIIRYWDRCSNSMEHSLFYYSQPARPPPSHSETALAGTPVRTVPKETERPSAIPSPVTLCIEHANLAFSLSHLRDSVLRYVLCTIGPLATHMNVVPLAIHR